MNLGELIEASRNLLDDSTDTDNLWTDTELADFINEAEREASIRGFLIRDSSSAITSINISSGTATYSLDQSIFFIEEAKLASASRPLTKTTRALLNLKQNDWTTKETNEYFIDDTGKITLVGTPSSSDTLNLSVYRLPTTSLSGNSDTPEIQERYHLGLLNWVLHRAYMKQDSETLDVDKSKAHLEYFVLEFGARPNNLELQIRKRV